MAHKYTHQGNKKVDKHLLKSSEIIKILMMDVTAGSSELDKSSEAPLVFFSSSKDVRLK